MKEGRRDFRGRVVLVLSLLLILAVGYIFVSAYGNWKQNRDLQIFQEGAQYGFEQAVIQVVQQASTCQQIPLTVQNNTLNIIAVECLKQP